LGTPFPLTERTSFGGPLREIVGGADNAAPQSPIELAAAARAEALQEGYREGVRLAEDEARQAVQHLAQLVDEAVVQADTLVASVEEEIVRLALAVAAKIVEREASIDPSVVLRAVHSALQETEHHVVVTVRVNPEDYELVLTHWGEVSHDSSLDHSRLAADERIQSGGCLIETTTGAVDGQLQAKIERITGLFTALLSGELA
jgi:flagellar assembly protein FliH